MKLTDRILEGADIRKTLTETFTEASWDTLEQVDELIKKLKGKTFKDFKFDVYGDKDTDDFTIDEDAITVPFRDNALYVVIDIIAGDPDSDNGKRLIDYLVKECNVDEDFTKDGGNWVGIKFPMDCDFDEYNYNVHTANHKFIHPHYQGIPYHWKPGVNIDF